MSSNISNFSWLNSLRDQCMVFSKAWPDYKAKHIEWRELDWTKSLLGTLLKQSKMMESYYRYTGENVKQMKRAHFIKDPSLMKEVLKKGRNSEEYSFGGLGDRIATVTDKANMLLCPLADHRKLRAPAEKSFTPRNQKELSKKIVPILMEAFINRWSRPFAIDSLVSFIVASALFGLKEKKLAYRIANLSFNSQKSLRRFYQRYQNAYEPGGLMARLQEAVAKKEITEEEAESTFFVLLNAGVHTTVNFLELWIAEMASNPEYVQAINREWNAFLLEYHVTIETKVDFQNALQVFVMGGEIGDSRYKGSVQLENCYLETLRLYPIIPELFRVADRDLTIGGFSIRQGDEIHLNCFGFQRDPSIWEDPGEFRPDRFSEHPELKHQLLNFSVGAQSCIGKHLAKTTSKLFMGMVTIFLSFEGKLKEERPAFGLFDFTLFSKSSAFFGKSWHTALSWEFIDANEYRSSFMDINDTVKIVGSNQFGFLKEVYN